MKKQNLKFYCDIIHHQDIRVIFFPLLDSALWFTVTIQCTVYSPDHTKFKTVGIFNLSITVSEIKAVTTVQWLTSTKIKFGTLKRCNLSCIRDLEAYFFCSEIRYPCQSFEVFITVHRQEHVLLKTIIKLSVTIVPAVSYGLINRRPMHLWRSLFR